MKYLVFILTVLLFDNSHVYCQNGRKHISSSAFICSDTTLWKSERSLDQQVSNNAPRWFPPRPTYLIQLAMGDCISMNELIVEKKYTYIVIWSASDATYMHEVVDSLTKKYQNSLSVIGLLDDKNLHRLKKIIRKQQISTIQGLLPKAMKQELQITAYPYGILFSREGRLMKKGIDKNELNNYIEKYVTQRKAKF